MKWADRLKSHVLKGSAILAVAVMVTALLSSLQFSYLDYLVLDLKGFLAPSEFSSDKAISINVSGIEVGAMGERGVPAKDLGELVKTIDANGAQRIILAMSPNDIIGSPEEMKELSEIFRQVPSLYLYSRWGRDKRAAFNNTPPFDQLKRQVILKTTSDRSLPPFDNKTRRFVLSMDDRELDQGFRQLSDATNMPLKSLEEYAGSFLLFETRQVYLRFYSPDSLGAHELVGGDSDRIKGKIVFLGGRNHYLSYMNIHPFGRFDPSGTESSDYYLSEPALLMTAYQNLTEETYIQQPLGVLNFILILISIISIIFLLVVFIEKPLLFFVCTLLFLLMLWGFHVFVFAKFSLNLDFVRVAIGAILIQYFGFPVMYFRILRRVDKEKLEIEKAKERERIKNRFILHFAKADSAFKVAAKVSHDIRGPLMALQVASNLVKGKISEDLEGLFVDSVNRLGAIAEDTLEMYRGAKKEVEAYELRDCLSSLLETYKRAYPEVQFEFEQEASWRSYIPRVSLERCISNLLNNSIEASMEGALKKCIQLSVKADGDLVSIRVADNGQGVPPQIRNLLFRERATFGKSLGTGLGLYQVKQVLGLYGANIEFDDVLQGASVTLKIPLIRKRVDLKVSKKIIVCDVDGETHYELRRVLGSSAEIFRVEEDDIDPLVLKLKEEPHEWSVFVDLEVNSDRGFRLAEAISSLPIYQGFLLGSVEENEELVELASSYSLRYLDRGNLRWLNIIVRSG